MSFHAPKKLMINHPTLGWGCGDNGAFFLKKNGIGYRMISSNGFGWEHVSVSLEKNGRILKRCPFWEEMCMIKNLFWDEEDCVVQFHPPKSEYVNNYEYCLHLWRKIGSEFERPTSYMVGLKT